MNVLPFPFERIQHKPPPGPLPVAWDGEKLRWDDWERQNGIILCGPAYKDATTTKCNRCGHDPGWSWRTYGYTLQKQRKRAPAWFMKLLLSRCDQCGHDQVYDVDAKVFWDLDPSDYGPCGSYADDDKPTLF